MSKVSVIIPSRNPHEYLVPTVRDLLTTGGDIEIIVALDRCALTEPLPEDKRVRVIPRNDRINGMRSAINAAVEVARGKYIMKIDEHCTIGQGWDEILQADCEDNWIVIPRRFWFDAPNWSVMSNAPVDAMYYIWPFKQVWKPRLTCRPWVERAQSRADIPIDEDMGFQGSLWFMTKAHYQRIGGMSDTGYGGQTSEPEELGLKTQLGPWAGAIMRNKLTWYAHWGKPNSFWRGDPEVVGRVPDDEREAGWLYTFDYWWCNRWPGRAHDFDWLIERCWPLPKWPENWRHLSEEYLKITEKDAKRLRVAHD
jgi:glycosyltransferase involved in cell wall biosynthesis